MTTDTAVVNIRGYFVKSGPGNIREFVVNP